MTSKNILLISRRVRSFGERSESVSSGHNLFERIIRDPQAPHRPARERLCSEMLCVLLLNAPLLRSQILGWLASLSGTPIESISELDLQIDTEQAIGSKRDDLRIEGWRRTDESLIREILWTVEIKVAAPFHLSTRQGDDETLAALETDESSSGAVSNDDASDLVNQLTNYDRWLTRQSAVHRAGFVLSVTRLELPPALRQSWSAFTWSNLADRVDEALAHSSLPSSEKVLADHTVDFIRNYLGDPTGMPIDFDDIALIRAFDQAGIACRQKINDLVGSTLQSLRANDATLEWTLQDQVFRENRRCCYWAYVAQDQNACLFAGIAAGDISVWIETSPAKSELKSQVRGALHQRHAALKPTQGTWRVADDRKSWHDIVYRVPLTELLGHADQQAVLQRILSQAVADLYKTEIISALRSLVVR